LILKAVILAGGLGTRISEETQSRPKPMIEVGGRPLLWHIMKIYSSHGVNDFVVCLGHKGYAIKEYFANYFLHMSDVTIDMTENRVDVHHQHAEPWRVTLVDTGEQTNTGGRLRKVAEYLGDEPDFCFTYGDGLADINVTEEIAFHRGHGKMATVLAVRPAGRFGSLRMQGSNVVEFEEKPLGDGGLISGGFFVLSRDCLQMIAGDDTSWERETARDLANAGQLAGFEHEGFWQPMDTLREKNELEALWASGEAPWKMW
jgi:glucose-1-phosphate cytidylyltransferase